MRPVLQVVFFLGKPAVLSKFLQYSANSLSLLKNNMYICLLSETALGKLFYLKLTTDFISYVHTGEGH